VVSKFHPISSRRVTYVKTIPTVSHNHYRCQSIKRRRLTVNRPPRRRRPGRARGGSGRLRSSRERWRDVRQPSRSCRRPECIACMNTITRILRSDACQREKRSY